MVKSLNRLGEKGEPFFFLISFDKQDFYASSLDTLKSDISFEFDGGGTKEAIDLDKNFLTFDEYEQKFRDLQTEITKGNTYLANLCCKTEIKTENSLKEIYEKSKGKYKLYFKDRFVCFSPETFVTIENNKIETHPMKGTIDSRVENAEDKILNNDKELAEHIMVVDLLRNDLSIVASKVRVEKFRYVEKVGNLLQVSSKIIGEMEEGWEKRIGEIFDKLLPAGSISGTPKKKTVEILERIEGFDRGFFTGVFGVYENKTLKSGVIIRYIEKENDKLYFKSGCGITESSKVLDEYNEMKEKVYVPIF